MISLPKEPKLIKQQDNCGTFEIEALSPGYGVTIGNALRRVLYSSLPGSAISQFKIKGISHEFSTLKHVLEDVMNIGLSLKQARFKLFSDQPQIGVIKVKGEREVLAKDIKFGSQQAEVVNSDLHIATITDKKGELEIEVKVERGLGYNSVESRQEGKGNKVEIGQIPLDAIFSPVLRVKYAVENMRVGKRTDFDRLVLDLETDGTISAQQAYDQAVALLTEHFKAITVAKVPEPAKAAKSLAKVGKSSAKTDKVSPTADKTAKAALKPTDSVNKMKVEELALPTRVEKALLQNGVKTVGSIIQKGQAGLTDLEGMGEAGLKVLIKKIKKLGLEIQ